MNAHVATDFETARLGCTHQRNTTCAGEAREVNAATGLAQQIQNRANRNRFRAHRNARQTQARSDFTIVRNAAARQVRIFRTQPHGVTVGGRILQRAIEHHRIDDGHVRVGESHATRLGELDHFGKALAAQTGR